MNNKPLVSVIIPVYNTERYVAEAVQSVLAQTYRPLEVICINDGSTDASLERLYSFGDAVRTIDLSENVGAAETRNIGAHASIGEYLAFMDADDLCEAEKIMWQMDAFDKNPSLDVCFTHLSCFISPELPEEVKQTRYCPPEPQAGYVAATVLMKRKVFDRVGDFDARWRVGEFIDWYTRAQEKGVRSLLLPDVLLRRRIHDRNMGVTTRGARGDYIRIAREALARKRKKD